MSPRLLYFLLILCLIGTFALSAGAVVVAIGTSWRRWVRYPLAVLLLAAAVVTFAQVFPIEAAFDREVRARATACIETGGIPLGKYSECERP